ncbi:MAG: RNA polymerase sigma factor [Gammaproteobacteria bacterium]
MRDTDRELERVLFTHAAALARLAASYESRPAPQDLEAVAEIADTEPHPDELAARMQGAERLRRAVHALPLTLRPVLVLAFEDLDREDIARVLGISAGNVAVRLQRGKALLKAELGERA